MTFQHTNTHTQNKEWEKAEIEYLCEKCFIVFSADIREASSVHTQKTEKKKNVNWLHKTIFMDKEDTLSFFSSYFSSYFMSPLSNFLW